MALPATSGQQPFNIEDAYVWPYLAGVPSATGGIDIPGIVQVTGAPQNTVVEHRGDGTVLSKVATFDSIDVTVTIGKWNTNAIVALVGGTSSNGGVATNQYTRLIHRSNDAPPDCAIKAQTHSRDVDGGGTRITFPRCQPQNIPTYGLNDQEYQDLEVNMSAIATAGAPPADFNMVIIEWMETYTPFSTTYNLPV